MLTRRPLISTETKRCQSLSPSTKEHLLSPPQTKHRQQNKEMKQTLISDGCCNKTNEVKLSNNSKYNYLVIIILDATPIQNTKCNVAIKCKAAMEDMNTLSEYPINHDTKCIIALSHILNVIIY